VAWCMDSEGRKHTLHLAVRLSERYARIPAMKVLLVHNRYRSDSPSGVNRVVDQEAATLEAAGSHVERFEYFSYDIAGWSRPRQALVPLRVVWSQEARRDLAAVLHRTKPDVVHVQNTFPSSALRCCIRAVTKAFPPSSRFTTAGRSV